MADATVPASIPTETALLGVLLLDNSLFRHAAALRPQDFFLPANQTIFEAILSLSAVGAPFDLVTLAEELDRQQKLAQVGGATYLSRLTDGQPKLSSIEHYVKVIRETARRRNLVEQATKIAHRALAGKDDIAALERQALTLESPAPAPVTEAPPKEERPTPTVPDAAWCPMARRYLEHAAPSTEASHNFHLAAFLTIAGALLGRLVYYNNPKPLYPNFFTALVGRSGRARKGTSIDFAEDIGRAVNPDLHWLRGINSAAGFVQALYDAEHRQEEGQRRTVSAILRFSELRSLIDKARQEGGRDIIPELANAFDSPPELQKNLSKGQTLVARPTVSILGGASPRWIEKMNIEDLEGGIGNRFCWVVGDPKKRNHRPPPPRFQFTIHDLGEARRYWLAKGKVEEGTEITMDAEADSIYETWYKSLDRHFEYDLFQILADRMEVHCPKVAMLYAALDGRAKIGRADIEAAIAYCEFLLLSLACIFQDYGWELAGKQDQELIAYVRRHPQGVAQRDAQMHFGKWGAETFHKRLNWLVGDDGQLCREQRGRRTWLILNRETE